MRRLVENLFAFLLGDASQNREFLPVSMGLLELVFLELVEAVEDFLLGLIANAAGVVEDQLGFLRGGNLAVALAQKGANDLFGVVGVHLAAERLDVKRLHFFYCNVGSPLQGEKRLIPAFPPRFFQGASKVFALLQPGGVPLSLRL